MYRGYIGVMYLLYKGLYRDNGMETTLLYKGCMYIYVERRVRGLPKLCHYGPQNTYKLLYIRTLLWILPPRSKSCTMSAI